MESRFRQSPLNSIVLATASALSTVLMAVQVKERNRAESSCVCGSSHIMHMSKTLCFSMSPASVRLLLYNAMLAS